MIKTENSKQSKVSFNSDFQRLLKMVKEDNSSSEDVSDLILNLVKDAELNYQSKLRFLKNYVKEFGAESLIYCPIYGTAKFSFSDDEGGNDFKKAEDFIMENKIKTSKIVKDSIKKLFDLPIVNFSEKEKAHLEFVLSMDTVD